MSIMFPSLWLFVCHEPQQNGHSDRNLLSRKRKELWVGSSPFVVYSACFVIIHFTVPEKWQASLVWQSASDWHTEHFYMSELNFSTSFTIVLICTCVGTLNERIQETLWLTVLPKLRRPTFPASLSFTKPCQHPHTNHSSIYIQSRAVS